MDTGINLQLVNGPVRELLRACQKQALEPVCLPGSKRAQQVNPHPLRTNRHPTEAASLIPKGHTALQYS